LIKLFIRCCLNEEITLYIISHIILLYTILSRWSILDNVVVMDMSVYMSVAGRNKCIFYIATVASCDTRLCSLKMSGKVREFDHDWRVASLYMSTDSYQSKQ